ncbi:MAG: hypothetical protein ACJARI_003044 [Bacteroidia bacterium]
MLAASHSKRKNRVDDKTQMIFLRQHLRQARKVLGYKTMDSKVYPGSMAV